ncbi:hypothetical protein [Glaciecola sp. 1036]|uniref:hypothetical protein n=1 Tax=Alteromonadaceae TaxID=72275 RepID=UPI003D080E7A
MDIHDQAQARDDFFRQNALKKHNKIASQPAIKIDTNGNALCIRCDSDISARRKIIPNAQRCIECQEDFEKGLR